MTDVVEAAEIVAHHLRLFGIRASSEGVDTSDVLVADAGADDSWTEVRRATDSGKPAIVLRPACCAALLSGVCVAGSGLDSPTTCRAVAAPPDAMWRRLRSLHAIDVIFAEGGTAVVATARGDPAWIWRPLGRAGVILIGTDLQRDLVRFRQGDPVAATHRPMEPLWGIAGERPVYLYERQLEPDRPHDRMADWWCWTLRDALVRHAGVTADAVLPFNASGAVIITGDDDQAPIEDYRAQATLLGDLPVTYFLHPLTKHTPTTLASTSAERSVEWELHPDALETPHEYGDRFGEQARWFTGLTGRKARLVRNHGYLNDGYWGHAKAWIEHDIVGSSNLPGLDGRVVNNSLLPARLYLDGALTPHWSVLTAFGDGVMFILGWDDKKAYSALMESAQRIVDSGVPGILVLNLHPANCTRAQGLHAAAGTLVERGFAAMTLGAALDWFAARDAGNEPVPVRNLIPPLGRLGDPGVRHRKHRRPESRLARAAKRMLGATRRAP